MVKKFFCVGLILVLTFLLLYIIMGEGSYVPVHDNLDSNVVWFKIIAESGKLFSPNLDLIEGIVGELSRLSYPSETDLLTWFYYFLPPWTAYLVNLVLIPVVAVTSMFLLLLKITKKRKRLEILAITSFSLLFALLPFWPSAGVSVAVQPLIIYLFLMISAGYKKVWPFFILFLIPFYSSLVQSGLFVGFTLFMWFLIDAFRNKETNKNFLSGFLLFVLGHVFASYRLFRSVVFPELHGFESHRLEMEPVFHGDLLETFSNFFFGGHYHAAKLPFIFGFLILFTTPFIFFEKNQLLLKLLVISTYCVIFAASILNWVGIEFLHGKLEVLKTFQLSRVFTLIPVLIFVSVFLIITRFFFKSKMGVGISLFIFILAILDVVRLDMNYRNIAKIISGKDVPDPTFKEFYSEDIFQKLKNDLALQDDVIISFGMHRAVPQYNGMVTIGGYSANYPLETKKNFLEMLGVNYSQNNPSYYRYMKEWGSRLYLF